jgi:hypothetical protein
VWRNHGELQLAESNNGNENDDQMDDMIADIAREYDIGSREQHPHWWYKISTGSLPPQMKKVHDGTDVTILHAVTCLLAIKLKYNFSNQWYNNIIKLIIDLILMKHDMPEDIYQSKKIVADLDMSYEKVDVCEKMQVVLKGAQG